MLELVRKVTRKFGFDILPVKRADEVFYAGVIPYITEEQKRIMEQCLPFTMTSRERMFALIRAAEYVSKNGIQGDLVECGVWRGGSVMAMARTFDGLKDGRNIFLFDTFEGMPEAKAEDIDLEGRDEQWYKKISYKSSEDKKKGSWNASSKDEVSRNLSTISPTRQKFNLIQGKVEDTIPSQAPQKIALLRLDTDFYSSTKHELTHLFPRLVKGGIIIVDDYGHFLGARKAVDEYFAENNINILMHRVDYTAIVGIKN